MNNLIENKKLKLSKFTKINKIFSKCKKERKK